MKPPVTPGMTFGLWTVLSGPHPYKNDPSTHRLMFRCQCICGKEKEVLKSNLNDGSSLSCGCVVSAKNNRARAKHGQYGTPEYESWRAMRERCLNPNFKQAADYRERGITFCRTWDDFNVFLQDLGPKPSRRHQLDRIDNDGGYWCGHCPECVAAGRVLNCRWSTRTEQANNTRRNRLITHHGETRTVAEWARHADQPPKAIQKRLELGWDLDRALSTPFVPRGPNRRGRKAS